jgi:UDPglucose 6-dehydrogenase
MPSGSHQPNLAFLGTGHLGAGYGICFAQLGDHGLGVDVDPAKVEKLNAGTVPPGLVVAELD